MQNRSQGGKDTQVKYSDPRMGYMSTRSELVVKESADVKMKDIFGEDILSKNSPAVVCEDQNGFYITSKDNVGVPLLDGYRMYRRDGYSITLVESEGGEDKEKMFKVVKDGKEIII